LALGALFSALVFLVALAFAGAPNQPDRITFYLPDIAHTWRQGHRIMVQVQSSWIPLTDRNPQKFMEIPKALSGDFQKAIHRVYLGGAEGSRIQLRVME
jgi:predicted acyl esterase